MQAQSPQIQDSLSCRLFPPFLYQPIEIIDGDRQSGNHNDDQNRIEPVDSHAKDQIGKENTEGHYGNRQPKGKDYSLKDAGLTEEDESPGKSRQEEDKDKAQDCPDHR
jgi:hypothetical protein